MRLRVRLLCSLRTHPDPSDLKPSGYPSQEGTKRERNDNCTGVPLKVKERSHLSLLSCCYSTKGQNGFMTEIGFEMALIRKYRLRLRVRKSGGQAS